MSVHLYICAQVHAHMLKNAVHLCVCACMCVRMLCVSVHVCKDSVNESMSVYLCMST